jgi:hypothetical protein
MPESSLEAAFAEFIPWIAYGAVVVIGIAGLYFAAYAHTPTHYWIGLGVFVAAVAVVFHKIHRALSAEQKASR